MDIIGVLLHVFEDIATISKSEMSARKDLFVVALQILPVARATGPLSLVVDYVRHHQVRLEPIRYRGEIEIIGQTQKTVRRRPIWWCFITRSR